MEVEVHQLWVLSRCHVDSLVMVDQLSDSRVPDCIEDLPGRDDLWSFLPHLALTLESERRAALPDSLSLALVPEVED